MHVQHQVLGFAVVVEQVLAPGVGTPQHGAVDERGALGEPALRAARADLRAGQQLLVAPGEAVDGVSLWHRSIVSSRGFTPSDERPAPNPARKRSTPHEETS
ncbi:hypothetical protein GCM10027270_23280 [Nocardioides ginkgobilobae]